MPIVLCSANVLSTRHTRILNALCVSRARCVRSAEVHDLDRMSLAVARRTHMRVCTFRTHAHITSLCVIAFRLCAHLSSSERTRLAHTRSKNTHLSYARALRAICDAICANRYAARTEMILCARSPQNFASQRLPAKSVCVCV